ncbi:hypothetical protein Stsp02_29330 [Streptomyces sp. NBRC 14336]|uniref:SAM-dependent methyltransferase n=1 Tax=Streptomyces sp. NBRC 14336 TaxID=3030992 RepID=UPI0024A0F4F3|nr:class I SAM-dependent methyltransferase [Streptomyces sp. NBRC 14336]WBO82172.1 class I SAM-dependent methyltransferase [Streptomyces sp. SBE_14.2]GLW47271.1 hypothetical protein Stsp02_29330 [Streptomyces sp. NBRC 14336]
MAGAVPRRITEAVALLDVRPADRLLEIGCGGGGAVQQLRPLLTTGTITAIDRSPHAVARAAARNSDGIEAGRVTLARAAFSAPELAAAGLSDRRYDKILAIDVNLFWTGPATAELALAADLLAPGGALYACYDPPGGRNEEIAAKVAAGFTAAGLTAEIVRPAPIVAVIGRP